MSEAVKKDEEYIAKMIGEKTIESAKKVSKHYPRSVRDYVEGNCLNDFNFAHYDAVLNCLIQLKKKFKDEARRETLKEVLKEENNIRRKFKANTLRKEKSRKRVYSEYQKGALKALLQIKLFCKGKEKECEP